MSNHFRINVEELKALTTVEAPKPDLSGINFAMLDMLEMWAEREWAKKQAGEPSEWDQSKWLTVAGVERTGTACGTAACLAGKAILMTPGVTFGQYDGGWKSLVDFSSFSNGVSFDNVLVPVGLVADSESLDTPVEVDGKSYYEMYASTAGKIILGLNTTEANMLFDGFNDLDAVKRIMTDIRKGEYRQVASDRREVPTTDVEVTTSALCDKDAQEYVREIVGDSPVSLYNVYGRCVNLAGHAEGEHTFQYT